MPRFAEIEGNRVRYILPPELADDYPVLVQNQVEIPLDADIVQGDIYEAGKFRNITTVEIQAQARPTFDAQRNTLFAETTWVRERFGDYKEMYALGLLTDTQITTIKTKYKEWLTYWNTLRDMPAQLGFDAAAPQWPKQPE